MVYDVASMMLRPSYPDDTAEDVDEDEAEKENIDWAGSDTCALTVCS